MFYFFFLRLPGLLNCPKKNVFPSSRFYSLHRLEQSSAETAVLPSSRSRATSTREHAPRALALQIARGIQDGRRLNPVTAIILQVLKYQKPSKTATIAKIQTIVIIMILCEYVYIIISYLLSNIICICINLHTQNNHQQQHYDDYHQSSPSSSNIVWFKLGFLYQENCMFLRAEICVCCLKQGPKISGWSWVFLKIWNPKSIGLSL